MKINSRTIHFFDLEVSTLSLDKSIPTPPQIYLNKLLPHLVPHIRDGMEIKCGKTPIEVTQIKWDASAEELVLLLNKPDPERSDVAYRKRNSKSRRLGDKATDEDIEVSSHILIKVLHNSTRAKMLLTIGASISPAKIIQLLNAAYKSAIETPSIQKLRNIPLPTNVLGGNGKAKTYEVNHRFTFSAMPNGMLSDIIQTGRIVGLNLIDTGTQAFDSSTNLQVDKMVMHINLQSESVDIPFIKKILGVARGKRKFDTSQVRIEYIDQGDDDNVVKKKTFDVARLEDAFTRAESIALDVNHFDHQTIISVEIIEKMLALT